MKKKYNILILMILILSLVVLAGCHEKYDLAQLAKEDAAQNPQNLLDSDNSDEESEEESSDDEGETSEEESNSNSQGTDTTSTTGADTNADENSDEETASGAPPATILGNTTTTTYTNSYYGIKFTAPNENWYIATDSELAQVMGMATSTIDDEAILETLQNSGFVMDLYALDTSESESSIIFDNINITIEDIGKMYGVLMSEQELAESTLEASKQTLQAQGWTDIEMEITEAVFAGIPRVCMESSSTKDGTTMYQKQVYLKKESYIACVTVASFGDDRTDQMLAAFTSL